MKLHADAFVTQGDTHTICQDYAMAGTISEGPATGLTFAVVSDGCSSSPMTDFGSRFLCLAARQYMESWGDMIMGSWGPTGLNGEAVIEAARKMADTAGLPYQCLDATLMVAFQCGGGIWVRVWGDGIVAWKTRAGVRQFSVVEFDHNAPAYLSYLLDGDRMGVYLDETNCGARRRTERMVDGALIDDFRTRGFGSTDLFFRPEDLELLVLCSDGVQTFHQPVEKVVDKLLDVKTSAGEFMVRRCRRILKQHRASGGRVDDDFSAAAIWCGDYVKPEPEE